MPSGIATDQGHSGFRFRKPGEQHVPWLGQRQASGFWAATPGEEEEEEKGRSVRLLCVDFAEKGRAIAPEVPRSLAIKDGLRWQARQAWVGWKLGGEKGEGMGGSGGELRVDGLSQRCACRSGLSDKSRRRGVGAVAVRSLTEVTWRRLRVVLCFVLGADIVPRPSVMSGGCVRSLHRPESSHCRRHGTHIQAAGLSSLQPCRAAGHSQHRVDVQRQLAVRPSSPRRLARRSSV